MAEKKIQITDSGGVKAFPLPSEFLQIGSTFTRTQDVPISGAGWYRFAKMAKHPSYSLYPQGLLIIGGAYGGYEFTQAMIAFEVIYGGCKFSPLVSSAKSSPTKVRITRDTTGHRYVDLYFSRAGNNSLYFGMTATTPSLEMLTPALVDAAPTGETIEGEYTIITTPPTPAIPATTSASGIADLAGLKAQMKTWIDEMGANSTGFFTVTLTNTISPISGIRLMIQINYSNLANYGSAIITTYKNSKGCNMYLMSYYNGAWTDPATVTAT